MRTKALAHVCVSFSTLFKLSYFQANISSDKVHILIKVLKLNLKNCLSCFGGFLASC